MRRGLVLTALAALLAGAPAASATRPATEPLRERASGFLTAPSERPPATVALDYVRDRPARFGLDEGDVAGLRLARSYRSAGGLVHLQWEQFHRGIPVFGPGLRANVDPDGRLINVGEGAQPDPAVPSVEPRLSALDALLAAGRAAGVAVVPGSPGAPAGRERLTRFGDGQSAHLTVFGDRLAWRVKVRGGDLRFYDAVVDASSGETLYRVNLVREATANVFDNYPGAPVGGIQSSRTLPAGWITDATRLFGTNAHVYHDADDDTLGFSADPAQQIPPQTADNWSWAHDARPAAAGQLCPVLGCSWEPGSGSFGGGCESQPGRYAAVLVHQRLPRPPARRPRDRLRPELGQLRGSRPRDRPGRRRLARTGPDCARHTNNAFVIPAAESHAAADAGLPLDERLPADGAAQRRQRGRRRDDRLPRVHPRDDQPAGHPGRRVAGHERLPGWRDGRGPRGLVRARPAQRAGLRARRRARRASCGSASTRTTSCAPSRSTARSARLRPPVPGSGLAGSGGYTYGDFARILGGAEVHADGEIWVETLWDLRNSLIAGHGRTEGITRARALVTDGLRLAPAQPDLPRHAQRHPAGRPDPRLRRPRARLGGLRGTGDGLPGLDEGNRRRCPDPGLLGAAAAPPPPRTTATAPARGVSRFTIDAASGSKVARRISRRFRFRLSEPGRAVILIERSEPGRRARGRCRPATRSLSHRPRCTRRVRPRASGARSRSRARQQRPAGAGSAAPRRLPGDDHGHRRRGQPLHVGPAGLQDHSSALTWTTG